MNHYILNGLVLTFRDLKKGPVMGQNIGPMIRVVHVVIFLLLLVLAAIIVEIISHNLYSSGTGAAPQNIHATEEPVPQITRAVL